MHVLVVFAHPRPASFTGEMLRAFCGGLAEGGHTFEVADLQAEGFQPVLEGPQFDLETAMDPEAPRPGDVAREQERLDRAQGLVLVYPFWWSDAPALLKGWFDRVWSYGYAYAYGPEGARTTRLGIRRALALACAGHSDATLDALGLREAHRRVMVEDRLLGVGIPAASLELLGGLSGNPPEVRARILARARALGRAFDGADPQPPAILPLGDPRLRAVAAPAGDPSDPEVARDAARLAAALAAFRARHGFGRGIAAPQVGIPRRMVALDLGKGPVVLLDPRITARGGGTFTLWDDCMCFPDLLVKVRRSRSVDLAWTDLAGRPRALAGLPWAEAELVQHELDHLDGILAVDRALDGASLVRREAFEADPEAFRAQVDAPGPWTPSALGEPCLRP